jgi:uncharacterized protein YjeT (DUF2065 family)
VSTLMFKERAMKLTRLSLYYLATYLPLAGLALLFVPDFATKLLLSNRTYEDTFMRVAGGLALGLGVLIIQIVRYRIEILYRWTLIIRVGLISMFAVLYARTSDPFFISLFVIVGFGVVLTAIGYYLDRRNGASVQVPSAA